MAGLNVDPNYDPTTYTPPEPAPPKEGGFMSTLAEMGGAVVDRITGAGARRDKAEARQRLYNAEERSKMAAADAHARNQWANTAELKKHEVDLTVENAVKTTTDKAVQAAGSKKAADTPIPFGESNVDPSNPEYVPSAGLRERDSSIAKAKTDAGKSWHTRANALDAAADAVQAKSPDSALALRNQAAKVAADGIADTHNRFNAMLDVKNYGAAAKIFNQDLPEGSLISGIKPGPRDTFIVSVVDPVAGPQEHTLTRDDINAYFQSAMDASKTPAVREATRQRQEKVKNDAIAVAFTQNDTGVIEKLTGVKYTVTTEPAKNGYPDKVLLGEDGTRITQSDFAGVLEAAKAKSVADLEHTKVSTDASRAAIEASEASVRARNVDIEYKRMLMRHAEKAAAATGKKFEPFDEKKVLQTTELLVNLGVKVDPNQISNMSRFQRNSDIATQLGNAPPVGIAEVAQAVAQGKLDYRDNIYSTEVSKDSKKKTTYRHGGWVIKTQAGLVTIPDYGSQRTPVETADDAPAIQAQRAATPPESAMVGFNKLSPADRVQASKDFYRGVGVNFDSGTGPVRTRRIPGVN